MTLPCLDVGVINVGAITDRPHRWGFEFAEIRCEIVISTAGPSRAPAPTNPDAAGLFVKSKNRGSLPTAHARRKEERKNEKLNLSNYIVP